MKRRKQFIAPFKTQRAWLGSLITSLHKRQPEVQGWFKSIHHVVATTQRFQYHSENHVKCATLAPCLKPICFSFLSVSFLWMALSHSFKTTQFDELLNIDLKFLLWYPTVRFSLCSCVFYLFNYSLHPLFCHSLLLLCLLLRSF